LREEIGKQLEHLRRQARQAEQYQAIQAERKIKDVEWKALEYRALDQKLQVQREKLSQQETRLQQLIAEQREAERELETGRVGREEAASRLNKAQAASYEVGGALARIEQQIQHQREMSSRLLKARDEAMAQLAEIGEHIGSDQSRLDVLMAAVADAEPRIEAMREDDEARQDALRDAENKLSDWQQRWDAHSREQSEAARAAEVER
ncbi:chromosome segregation protein SMC, partial [Lysobacter sp. 2RAB21]